MHELMVTQSILEITQRHAQQAGASRVTDLYLVIGDLSSVIDDSVQFYWDFISEGTVAEGARLHFRRIATKFACQDCDQNFGPDEGLTCPNCKSSNINVVAGQEFILEAIEVADEPSGDVTVPETGEAS